MRDVVLLGALLGSFAVLVVAHGYIAMRLFVAARPRYRGVLALLVPPLAPYWAHGQGWRSACWVWVGAVVAYTVLLAVAKALG